MRQCLSKDKLKEYLRNVFDAVVIDFFRSLLHLITGGSEIKHEAEVQLENHRKDSANLVASVDKLLQNDVVLAAINTVLTKAVTCETEEELAKTCLDVAQELSGAKFGYLGEITPAGKFTDLGISDPGWEECRMPESQAVKLIQDMEIRGMQFLPLKDGISRIFNDPSSHPDSVGTPEGHPEITSLLAVPLKHKGKVIGGIGLGNKEGGFDENDKEAVEALSVAVVQAIKRMREWRQQK